MHQSYEYPKLINPNNRILCITLLSDQYDSTPNLIKSDQKLPRMLKEYMSNTLLQSLFCAVATAPNILKNNYQAIFNKWRSNDTIDYTPPAFDSNHFDRIRKHVEFNSSSLLTGDQLGSIKYEFNMPHKWLTNTKKGLLLEIKPSGCFTAHKKET